MANHLLTDELSAPLNGAKTAIIDINSGSGNLSIDELPDGEHVLATGTLEYFEKQGKPTHSLSSSVGQASLAIKGGAAGQPWFRLPWTACLGASDWRIHLNRAVAYDITAHTGGGNVKLNLADAAVGKLSADSGGGNLDVVLPEHAADLRVSTTTGGGNICVEIGSETTGANTLNAKSGAGNVLVRLPAQIAARVHANSGFGKVAVEPRFTKIDKQTYETADYAQAVDRIEVALSSGAGDVSVTTK